MNALLKKIDNIFEKLDDIAFILKLKAIWQAIF
jgi:hypothetical protein